MKLALAMLLAVTACKKDSPSPTSETASGSAPAPAAAAPATPVEDVSCKDAAKAFATKMAKLPGNVLSDAKPDSGLISWTALSMEDYCTGEPDNPIVPWTAQERACAKSADNPESCFVGNSLTQVRMGLDEVVTNALANKKKNAAEAGSAEKPAE